MPYGWLNRMGGGPGYGWLGGSSSAYSALAYQLDFYDGTITPQFGAAPTYTRAIATYAYDTTDSSSIDLFASGDPKVETFPEWLPTAQGGMHFSAQHANRILQSEAPATTWTTVGTPTSVNNALGTWGNVSYGTIVSAASGDGITQTSG